MARRQRQAITRVTIEEQQLKSILANMPANPVPWASLLRMVAPVIARLAVRYALKRAKRGMAEDKVLSVSNTVSELIESILGQNSGGA